MRGIIKEERNGRFRVSAGRTDEGIWVDTVDMVFMYREGMPKDQARPGDWAPVLTDDGYHLCLFGANGERVLTSQIYASDMEGVQGAMAVVAKTPPFLGPVRDERTMGEPRTQEEKVAFRKDWDKRVEEGKRRAGDDQDS